MEAHGRGSGEPGFESPYLQTPPPRLGSERLRLAGREVPTSPSTSLPATRVQFGLGAVLHHSITPSLRAAGFEDEDENEAPCEELRAAVKITLGPAGRPGS